MDDEFDALVNIQGSVAVGNQLTKETLCKAIETLKNGKTPRHYILELPTGLIEELHASGMLAHALNSGYQFLVHPRGKQFLARLGYQVPMETTTSSGKERPLHKI